MAVAVCTSKYICICYFPKLVSLWQKNIHTTCIVNRLDLHTSTHLATTKIKMVTFLLQTLSLVTVALDGSFEESSGKILDSILEPENGQVSVLRNKFLEEDASTLSKSRFSGRHEEFSVAAHVDDVDVFTDKEIRDSLLRQIAESYVLKGGSHSL